MFGAVCYMLKFGLPVLQRVAMKKSSRRPYASLKKDVEVTPPRERPAKKLKTENNASNPAEDPLLASASPTLPVSVQPLKNVAAADSLVNGVSLKSLKFIGAHTSISKGPQTAIEEALAIKASAFALFVRSARTWTCPKLTDDAVVKFRARLVESKISPSKIVCHGSYLINPGAPDAEILTKSRAGMLDEMQRCERLGIAYYNIHPGSTCGKITVKECIARIADSVNQTLTATKDVVLLLENMCGQGNTIGGKLQELADIVATVDAGVRDRVGVCLDTCHAFAAGHDLSNLAGWNKFMTEVEAVIGLERVKAFHLNDSTFAVGSHRDRHARIGKGFIGLEGFTVLMNDPRTNNLPMILETDGEAFAGEVALLYSLCKM